MALSLLTYPGDYSAVTNEMLFVVSEPTKTADPTTYPNYKYVLDVYVGSDLVGRLKANPDPTNLLGIFDVSRILRYYVPEYRLKANYSNASETYDIDLSYHVEVGEEYGDTTYTNIITDSTRTCYKTYAEKPYLSTDVITAKYGGPLSVMPTDLVGFKDDKFFLVPFIDNTTGAAISYNFDDGVNIIGSGGSITYSTTDVLQTNMSFQKLAAAVGLTPTEMTQVSRLQFDYDTGTSYTVNYGCSRFPSTVIAWLNPYGAYESYSFGLVSKKTKEISRKEFAQLPYQINASGVVSYDADGVLYGSRKTYNTVSEVKLNLNSHLLSDDEYTWLADLFSSSDVYMFDTVLDRFVPVTITDTNYEYRTYLNSRLTPLSFTIQFTDTFNSQYL
jgi:hypothetical protein